MTMKGQRLQSARPSIREKTELDFAKGRQATSAISPQTATTAPLPCASHHRSEIPPFVLVLNQQKLGPILFTGNQGLSRTPQERIQWLHLLTEKLFSSSTTTPIS